MSQLRDFMCQLRDSSSTIGAYDICHGAWHPTYSEGDSKAARTRNNLLVKVIRGATVLKLRDEIDTYPACSPEDMVRLDRSIVAVSFGAEKILTKRFFSDRMKLRPSLSAD